MNVMRGVQRTKATPHEAVACVACGRVLRKRKNGHPYQHKPHNRLQNRHNSGADWCDGSLHPGEKP